MYSPKFSILVPVYNVELWIKEAIESILAQDIDDYEVILIDDGSMDNSGKICDEYQKQYPEKFFVTHRQNKGLISARREAIQKACGKYCIFLDSDDYLESNCLYTLNNLIESNPDVSMIIYGMSYLYMENGNRLNGQTLFAKTKIFEAERKELYMELIKSTRLNNLFLKAIDTKLLQQDPTDYTVYFDNSYGEDLLQTLYPITYAEKIICIPDRLYVYRIHNNSMIHKFDAEKLEKRFGNKVDSLLHEYMHLWGMDSKKEITILSAHSYKHVVDTLVQCWIDNPRERKSIRMFIDKYLALNQKPMLEVIKCNDITLSNRIAIWLYAHKALRMLGLYYQIIQRILRFRSR